MTNKELQAIVNADRFMDMTHSQQCLYFHAVANANEDGVVYGINALARALGCPSFDVMFLVDNGYIEQIIDSEFGHCRIANW